ncbi:MAG: peroxide stress protein YaaA [Oceanospirillaceae bacterium]|nr:peroxide stress protein YaaA [Oceanospirillaceae bacterium]MCP5334825.1 peroxide stress protein YaaA [Oceanospirillaceae bacterium]MCP5349496.1 peroxide stress protein YaaA [Oceanospirillaceae bacterium]
MLMVISPAKTLDFESPLPVADVSMPDLLQHSAELIDQLKTLAPHEIAELMGLSSKLAELNSNRFIEWQLPFTPQNARPAVFAFDGDVYTGLDAYHLNAKQIAFAQQHLRILSGLYGLLRPLDLMQAYRLEMGTRLENIRGKDLYQFWGDVITEALNAQLTALKTECLLNLASGEYFKSVKKNKLKARIITPIFKDQKNGQYKIISFYAKKARGLMAAYVIRNEINDVSLIRDFDVEGYYFCAEQSSADEWVFLRDHAQ